MDELVQPELIKTDKIFYPQVHYSEGTVDYPPGTKDECIAAAEYVANRGVWDGVKNRFYPPSTIISVWVVEIKP